MNFKRKKKHYPEPEKNFIKAKKALGQNFCVDERLPDEIVAQLAVSFDDHIWEIGPGKGALTQKLVLSNAGLTLFEIDKVFEGTLQSSFPETEIVWGDFLKIDLSQIVPIDKDLFICGNLPYYCATPIIKNLLESSIKIKRMVFLLQEEVALKAAAVANDKNYGYLSVHTAFFANTRLGNTYYPDSFVPKPLINSKILVLEPLNLSPSEKKFRLSVLKQLSPIFAQRRKMVLPLLKKIRKNIDWQTLFDEYKIDDYARIQNISAQTLLELFSDEAFDKIKS